MRKRAYGSLYQVVFPPIQVLDRALSRGSKWPVRPKAKNPSPWLPLPPTTPHPSPCSLENSLVKISGFPASCTQHGLRGFLVSNFLRDTTLFRTPFLWGLFQKSYMVPFFPRIRCLSCPYLNRITFVGFFLRRFATSSVFFKRCSYFRDAFPVKLHSRTILAVPAALLPSV